MRLPILSIAHGGGPMPLLERKSGISKHLSKLSSFVPKDQEVKTILLITAHWEEDVVHISSSLKPSLYFDYGGFPPETYKYKYPVNGNPSIANRAKDLLERKGINAALDTRRGLDHGTFVPLMLAYPEASIPVVQMSILSSLDPKEHTAIGEALAPLREEGVLIIGSGYSFHNMREFFSPPSKAKATASKQFDTWLFDTLSSKSERLQRIHEWEKIAPYGRYCHPREEHLVPLFVCAGAADTSDVDVIYSTDENGISVSSFRFLDKSIAVDDENKEESL